VESTLERRGNAEGFFRGHSYRWLIVKRSEETRTTSAPSVMLASLVALGYACLAMAVGAQFVARRDVA
jgi:hypothetical protein